MAALLNHRQLAWMALACEGAFTPAAGGGADRDLEVLLRAGLLHRDAGAGCRLTDAGRRYALLALALEPRAPAAVHMKDPSCVSPSSPGSPPSSR